MITETNEASGSLRDSDYRIEDLKIIDTVDATADSTAVRDHVLSGSVFDVQKEREARTTLAQSECSVSDRMLIRRHRAARYVKCTLAYVVLYVLTIGALVSIGPDSPKIAGVVGIALAAVLAVCGFIWLIGGIVGVVCSLIWPPRVRVFTYLLGMLLPLAGAVAVHMTVLTMAAAVKAVGR